MRRTSNKLFIAVENKCLDMIRAAACRSASLVNRTSLARGLPRANGPEHVDEEVHHHEVPESKQCAATTSTKRVKRTGGSHHRHIRTSGVSSFAWHAREPTIRASCVLNNSPIRLASPAKIRCLNLVPEVKALQNTSWPLPNIQLWSYVWENTGKSLHPCAIAAQQCAALRS